MPGGLSGGVILNRVQQGGGHYEMTAVSGDMLVAVPPPAGLAVDSGNVGRPTSV